MLGILGVLKAYGIVGMNPQAVGTAIDTAVPCCLRGSTAKHSKAPRPGKCGGKGQLAAAAAPKPHKSEKVKQVRMCRFCEVAVPKDEMVAAHLSGKRHRKLAGGRRAAEECFVWLEKEPAAQAPSPQPGSLAPEPEPEPGPGRES